MLGFCCSAAIRATARSRPTGAPAPGPRANGRAADCLLRDRRRKLRHLGFLVDAAAFPYRFYNGSNGSPTWSSLYPYTFIEEHYGDVTSGTYAGGCLQHPVDDFYGGEHLLAAVYAAIRNSQKDREGTLGRNACRSGRGDGEVRGLQTRGHARGLCRSVMEKVGIAKRQREAATSRVHASQRLPMPAAPARAAAFAAMPSATLISTTRRPASGLPPKLGEFRSDECRATLRSRWGNARDMPPAVMSRHRRSRPSPPR